MSDERYVMVNDPDKATTRGIRERDLRAVGWVPVEQQQAALELAHEWAQTVENCILENARPGRIKEALAELRAEEVVVFGALGAPQGLSDTEASDA